jgi:ribosomal protein L37AE/L43A
MNALIWVVLGGLLLAAAVGAFLFVRSRAAPVEEDYLHFRCPSCKRRLRFRRQQSGHAGQCSHCGGKLVFPPASQSCT